ncbi:MAG TPA: hypothetical protein VGB48_03495 [Allosphingosinicella sp.]
MLNGSGDFLVGMVAAVVAGMILGRIVRGLREGRLPVYRTYIGREAGAAKFNTLLALHAISLLAVALIAIDLLLGLNLKDAL